MCPELKAQCRKTVRHGGTRLSAFRRFEGDLLCQGYIARPCLPISPEHSPKRKEDKEKKEMHRGRFHPLRVELVLVDGTAPVCQFQVNPQGAPASSLVLGADSLLYPSQHLFSSRPPRKCSILGTAWNLTQAAINSNFLERLWGPSCY